MINLLKKSSTLAAAALALGFAVMPMSSAEARYYRNGYLAAGVLGGAVLGGALLAPRVYGRPAPVYVEEEPACRRIRERVWDDYRGRWVMVRRTVCD
ncbi:MAG: hypothetical protein CFE31_08100 [Rhizobiales bacterium PAR1]|nr:MAG: hypothetical protein CFE31_08100 [Rhizobiales bacterium PAR1]